MTNAIGSLISSIPWPIFIVVMISLAVTIYKNIEAEYPSCKKPATIKVDDMEIKYKEVK